VANLVDSKKEEERKMGKVLVTAEVEEAVSWVEGFVSHADMFKRQGVSVIHYAVTDANEVAVLSEVEDTDAYVGYLVSPETAEAMEYDGVKRETVKIYALDRELRP